MVNEEQREKEEKKGTNYYLILEFKVDRNEQRGHEMDKIDNCELLGAIYIIFVVVVVVLVGRKRKDIYTNKRNKNMIISDYNRSN